MYDTYGNIPLKYGETAEEGWVRYQTQLAEDKARAERVAAMRQQMTPAPVAPSSTSVVDWATPVGATAGQMLRDPSPGIDSPFVLGPLTPYQQPAGGTYYPGASTFQPGAWVPWQPGAQQSQPAQSPQNEYQMPVLSALYQAQQQRMAAPAPQFNFQSKGPLSATAGAPPTQGVAPGEPASGALTTVINGG